MSHQKIAEILKLTSFIPTFFPLSILHQLAVLLLIPFFNFFSFSYCLFCGTSFSLFFPTFFYFFTLYFFLSLLSTFLTPLFSVTLCVQSFILTSLNSIVYLKKFVNYIGKFKFSHFQS